MKKIAVVTTTRADYGIYTPLLRTIESHDLLELQLIVTGTHLEAAFGETIKQMADDGFKIAAQIPMSIKGDSHSDIANSMAVAQTGFEKAFSELNPDLVFVLGDRYELIPICMSALLHRIPIAHIHGGETTMGAIDENIRHAVTKFSALHFTSCDLHRHRVIQMGEHPSRVFNVGSLAVENIKSMTLLSREELEKDLGVTFRRKNIILTFHPETQRDDSALASILVNVCKVLGALPEDVFVLITGSNADHGGRLIDSTLREYAQGKKNFHWIANLGVRRYFSALKEFDLLMGNSSSAIIEAPSFDIKILNLGDRQKGRRAADWVVHADILGNGLGQLVCRLLDDDSYGKKNGDNPYEGLGTSKQIVSVLSSLDLSSLTIKEFYDVNYEQK